MTMFFRTSIKGKGGTRFAKLVLSQISILLPNDARAAFPAKQADVESLARAWDALEARWQALLGGLTDEDLDRPVVRIRPSAPDKPLTSRLSDVLLHGGTHAYYHTAQAINMMRHLGVQPLPDTMLIVMSRMGL